MISLTTWGRSQAFFHLKCKFILPHMGKESCLLPQSLCTLPQLLPKIQHYRYPFPQCREGFFPAPSKINVKPLQILPYKFFLYLYFSCYFYLSIYFFLFSFLIGLFSLNFLFFSFFFFFPKLGILPQSGKIIPQHLGRIIEE